MTLEQGMAVVEAILFATGEPIKPDKLSEASGIDEPTIIKIIDQLSRRYSVTESGFEILRLDGAFQLATKQEYAEYIRAALENRRKQPLSQAAMEVLAIIAYNQPVTRAFVEQVRGVDSSGVISNLLSRELIEEAGRLDLPGRPTTYRTTDTFLRSFSLSSLAQLPPLPDPDGQLALHEVVQP